MGHDRCDELWEEHCKGVRSHVLSSTDSLLSRVVGFYVRGKLVRDIRFFHLFCIILLSLPFLPRSLKITEDKEGSDRTTSAAPPHLEAITAQEG